MDVIDIPMERLEEAADVLARAFAEYPLMTYFFEGSGVSTPEGIRVMFRFTCEGRIINGEPVKGIVQDGRLVAVACLDGLEPRPWPESVETAFDAFAEKAGEQALARFGRFRDLTTAHKPAEPHLYLVAIGVLPEAQGQGFGRALLDHVHEMSAAHPASTGVALDTETPANVPLYEHCGYSVTAQGQLGDVPVWCLFRPDRASAL